MKPRPPVTRMRMRTYQGVLTNDSTATATTHLTDEQAGRRALAKQERRRGDRVGGGRSTSPAVSTSTQGTKGSQMRSTSALDSPETLATASGGQGGERRGARVGDLGPWQWQPRPQGRGPETPRRVAEERRSSAGVAPRPRRRSTGPGWPPARRTTRSRPARRRPITAAARQGGPADDGPRTTGHHHREADQQHRGKAVRELEAEAPHQAGGEGQQRPDAATMPRGWSRARASAMPHAATVANKRVGRGHPPDHGGHEHQERSRLPSAVLPCHLPHGQQHGDHRRRRKPEDEQRGTGGTAESDAVEPDEQQRGAQRVALHVDGIRAEHVLLGEGVDELADADLVHLGHHRRVLVTGSRARPRCRPCPGSAQAPGPSPARRRPPAGRRAARAGASTSPAASAPGPGRTRAPGP